MLRSMRETIRLNKRAIGIWWRESPGMLVSLFFYVVTGALLPYAGIYFSARIITELSGAKDPVILRNLVLLLLGIESVAGLLYHYFKNRYTVERNDMTANLTQILSEKMLSLDFAKVDDSVIQDKVLQIEQINRWNRLGLCMVVFTLERMLQAIAGIAGALMLTVSFFQAKAVKEAFLWMNSPLFMIVFLAGILGFTTLASRIVERAQNMIAELSERATFGNRVWSFMAGMAGEREREQDIRVYEQIPAVMGFYEKNKVWGIGTGMDRLEKGKGGILSAVAKMTERLCSGLVYLLVCLKAYGGAFGIGAVTQYISAVTALSHNLEELLGALGEVHTNREFLKKTLDFLDTPNDMYQGSLTVEKRNDCQYEVEFRDVSFCYPGTDRKVLDHVNLKFRIGEKLAIVGENGSGKSTFINTFAGKACAKTGNKPGVTKGKQWIRINKNVELLDTPGILWPKFEDQSVGAKLAMIGSMNDQILNLEELSLELLGYLHKCYEGILAQRYELEESEDRLAMLSAVAKNRNCLKKGNELDYAKASNILLEEFRNGKIGRITLEQA